MKSWMPGHTVGWIHLASSWFISRYSKPWYLPWLLHTYTIYKLSFYVYNFYTAFCLIIIIFFFEKSLSWRSIVKTQLRFLAIYLFIVEIPNTYNINFISSANIEKDYFNNYNKFQSNSSFIIREGKDKKRRLIIFKFLCCFTFKETNTKVHYLSNFFFFVARRRFGINIEKLWVRLVNLIHDFFYCSVF